MARTAAEQVAEADLSAAWLAVRLLFGLAVLTKIILYGEQQAAALTPPRNRTSQRTQPLRG